MLNIVYNLVCLVWIVSIMCILQDYQKKIEALEKDLSYVEDFIFSGNLVIEK